MERSQDQTDSTATERGPGTTRRQFLTRVGAAAAGATALSFLGTGAAHADTAIDFATAAIGAERIGVTFYDNALGIVSPYGVAADAAKSTLLNSSHREYFMAARNQEAEHLAVLQSLGVPDFPFHTFAFPAGTFSSAAAMLAFGEKLEGIFIGAYLGAVKVAASESNDFVAEAAAQIMGIECEHRVLIRDIAGEDPPNDRWFEGGITMPNGTLGNTGVRSTVYATGNDAVTALVSLGISPN